MKISEKKIPPSILISKVSYGSPTPSIPSSIIVSRVCFFGVFSNLDLTKRLKLYNKSDLHHLMEFPRRVTMR